MWPVPIPSCSPSDAQTVLCGGRNGIYYHTEKKNIARDRV